MFSTDKSRIPIRRLGGCKKSVPVRGLISLYGES